MGTVALIAISKLIFKIQATFLETLRKTLRKAKQHSNFVRFWQACCLCCVHVHQRFYRYISKHALVQTCIWGDPFKSASQKSFFLLRRHQEQVKNMDSVSTYILFQTKVNKYLEFSLIKFQIVLLLITGRSICVCISFHVYEDHFWKRFIRP